MAKQLQMQHSNKEQKTVYLSRLLGTWCGPCQRKVLILDKLSEELS